MTTSTIAEILRQSPDTPLAWLVHDGRLYKNKVFISEIEADGSIAARADGAQKTALVGRVTSSVEDEQAADRAIQQVVADQGWDDATLVIHLRGFIAEAGLLPRLAHYLSVVAKEENDAAEQLGVDR